VRCILLAFALGVIVLRLLPALPPAPVAAWTCMALRVATAPLWLARGDLPPLP